MAFKKRSVRPSSRLKTVDLDCRSSLSVARLVRFWFKSLQSLTVHDRQFLQGNVFLLAVCTHDVGLYLCSIFCTRSLLQFCAASYRAFGERNTPHATVSHNLNLAYRWFSWNVASLPEGKSRGLCLAQLCTKYRLVGAALSLYR